MEKFKITYGVGGGYNDIQEEVIEAKDLDAARAIAYEMAQDVFDIYGIYDNEVEFAKEDDNEPVDYNECLESWIDYNAVPLVEAAQ